MTGLKVNVNFQSDAKASGATTPNDTDGISFLPTLLGQEGQEIHEFLYWEFGERGGKIGLVTDKWKAVRLNTTKKPDGPIELYDLAADESEETDVAAKHPEIVAEMAKRLEESHTAP